MEVSLEWKCSGHHSCSLNKWRSLFTLNKTASKWSAKQLACHCMWTVLHCCNWDRCKLTLYLALTSRIKPYLKKKWIAFLRTEALSTNTLTLKVVVIHLLSAFARHIDTFLYRCLLPKVLKCATQLSFWFYASILINRRDTSCQQ